jgi:ubiquitin-like modifier-activating enzyme 5
MGIVAGMLVQNTLKHLLCFGKVSMYVGYSALEDFFPSWEIRPNDQCDDKQCLLRQKEFQANPVTRKRDFMKKDDSDILPVHEECFGIEVVEETAVEDLVDDTKVSQGLRTEYTKVSSKEPNQGDGDLVADSGESLDELMAKMRNL